MRRRGRAPGGAPDRVLDDAGAVEHVGRLPEDQPEVRPLDEQIVEVDEPLATAMRAAPRRASALENRRAQPRVHAPLQLDELELHVDGAPRAPGGCVLKARSSTMFARLHAAGRRRALVGEARPILARARRQCASPPP